MLDRTRQQPEDVREPMGAVSANGEGIEAYEEDWYRSLRALAEQRARLAEAEEPPDDRLDEGGHVEDLAPMDATPPLIEVVVPQGDLIQGDVADGLPAESSADAELVMDVEPTPAEPEPFALEVPPAFGGEAQVDSSPAPDGRRRPSRSTRPSARRRPSRRPRSSRCRSKRALRSSSIN